MIMKWKNGEEWVKVEILDSKKTLSLIGGSVQSIQSIQSIHRLALAGFSTVIYELIKESKSMINILKSHDLIIM